MRLPRTVTTLALLIIAVLAGTQSARATTVDTFAFTQGNWFSAFLVDQTVIPEVSIAGGILTGSFTGKVEPDGLIELSDLTSFSATYSDSIFWNREHVCPQ